VSTWMRPRMPKAIEAPTNMRVAIFCMGLVYQMHQVRIYSSR
jgi:hypothetical protein